MSAENPLSPHPIEMRTSEPTDPEHGGDVDALEIYANGMDLSETPLDINPENDVGVSIVPGIAVAEIYANNGGHIPDDFRELTTMARAMEPVIDGYKDIGVERKTAAIATIDAAIQKVDSKPSPIDVVDQS